MRARSFLLILLIASTTFAQIPGDITGGVLLPNGWKLSPAGRQFPLGDLPMNAVMSADERWLVVSNSGQSKADLRLVDLNSGETVQTIRMKDTWWGLTRQDSLLVVSGGYQNAIHSFILRHGQLTDHDSVALSGPLPKGGGGMAGVAVNKNLWACVLRADSTLRVTDRSNGVWTITKLGGMPYDAKFAGDGSLLVSLWSSRRVVRYTRGVDGWVKSGEYRTGDHPNEITVLADGDKAMVSCANDNTVSIIDLKSTRVLASVGTAVHPDAPEGSTTNSTAEVPGKAMLLSANADNNSLTVIDVRKMSKPVPVGFIPVGWYPTKVLVKKDRTILVLNGKGGRSFANPKRQYIGGLLPGSLSIIPFPSEKELERYSKQVFANTPYKRSQLTEADFTHKGPVPNTVGGASPIKHVFYIIRENRTYDQVLGDMPQGNGDSSLTIFGASVTPNYHTLAKEFVLFDNYYVNSEVSADGHNWTVAAYATDFVEKSWPGEYGGRGGKYVYEGDERTGRPKAGYIWNQCARKKVSFRSYGEFITANDSVGGPGTPRDESLIGHFAPYYRGWDMDYSDVDRYRAWEKEFTEFEANGKLPQMNIFHLPNNHTQGTRKGALSPRAYAAQNDFALGLIVDRISRSKYWKSSVICVVEDDAQDGPDHVDAHRSVALVLSPYTRRGVVDHTLYTTASMLRTMELILGLPPMSQYDASATPMASAFMAKPDPRPYEVVEPTYDINERNPSGSVGENLMEEYDFSKEDRINDRMFNEVIWQSIKGTPMPAPRYTVFSRQSLGGDPEEGE